MINLVSDEIAALEKVAAEINTTSNVSEVILERYANVQRELQLLQQANNNFEKKDELSQRINQLTDRLNALILQVIAQAQEKVNNTMLELNFSIYSGEKTAPTLTIQDASHYLFLNQRIAVQVQSTRA